MNFWKSDIDICQYMRCFFFLFFGNIIKQIMKQLCLQYDKIYAAQLHNFFNYII